MPGSRCLTAAPGESVSLIVNPGPTTPDSVRLWAPAPPAAPSTAATAAAPSTTRIPIARSIRGFRRTGFILRAAPRRTAPRALHDQRRSLAASSSESVRSADWNGPRRRSTSAPRPPARPGRHRRRASPAAPGRRLPALPRQAHRPHLLVDGEREILRAPADTDHVLVGDRLARAGEQHVQVELEHAPRPGEQAPDAARRRAPAPVEPPSRDGSRSSARSIRRPRRGEPSAEPRRRPWPGCSRPRRSPPRAALVRQGSPGRYTRASSNSPTECAVLDVAADGVDEAREQAGPQRRRAPRRSARADARRRVGSSGRSEGVYVSANPSPASTSSTRRERRWSGVSAPNMRGARGSVNGTSSIRKRAISSTTSISRGTSRARQVGDDHIVAGDSKPRRPSSARWSSAGVSRPMTSSARSGGRRSRAGRGGRPARRCARPSGRPRSRRSAAWRGRAAGSARCGSTPFSHRFEPSVRSRSRSELRKMPIGSKFAASSRTSVVSSPISVSSPPMIPASATARSASAISEVAGLERALDAVQRAQRLARPPPAARRSCRRADGRSRRRAAGCRARAIT